MRLYQNGLLIASAAQSGTIVMPTNDLHIGRRDAFSSHMDGSIDEVRIYNRDLTDAEISALAQISP